MGPFAFSFLGDITQSYQGHDLKLKIKKSPCSQTGTGHGSYISHNLIYSGFRNIKLWFFSIKKKKNKKNIKKTKITNL